MKRGVSIIVSLICVGILAAYPKQALPIPQYPLDADTIIEAMQEMNLSYDLEEDKTTYHLRSEQTLFGMYNDIGDKFVAGISSGQKDGERILYISFPRFYSSNAILREDCKDAIIFATCLFGGFSNLQKVYDVFAREYGTKNTVRNQYEVSLENKSPSPIREGGSCWETTIDNITCRITFEQPKLSESEEYLSMITFFTDWETFHPVNIAEGITTN